MRYLKISCTGEDIEDWQHFLRGLELYKYTVDGEFGPKTHEATIFYQKIAQKKYGDVGKADGIVGPKTFAAAFRDGFCPLEYDGVDEYGPNWPPPPDDLLPLKGERKIQLLGHIKYVAAPSKKNPEGIRITNNWVKENIIRVHIPQLKSVQYAPSSNKISWHKNGVDQLVSLWQTWEDEDLLQHVLTWAGSWNPRFIRGSRTVLSNHAYASAIDINAPWNGLGKQPALKGEKGSVRELVEIAAEHKFWWGGWGWPKAFDENGKAIKFGRPDGMHFELADIW